MLGMIRPGRILISMLLRTSHLCQMEAIGSSVIIKNSGADQGDRGERGVYRVLTFTRSFCV